MGCRAQFTLLLAAAAGRISAGEPSRLRITNGCGAEPLWVAHEAAGGAGPDPQNVKIAPLASYDFTVYDGLTGTRYWPKMRCDASGSSCSIGESGGPGEDCGFEAGCAPPVDTKFEASFGQNGVDWVDVSLVDGFTLPFKFEMIGEGNCTAGFGEKNASKLIDCSRLAVSQCPTAEDLGSAGESVNLQVIHPETEAVVGCYSPCSKLTLGQWGNSEADGVAPQSDRAAPFCCPTPPESPHACRAGPVGNTDFVQVVHEACPGVYGFSYDDGMGLLQCPSDMRYEVTFFCPSDVAPAAALAAPVPAAALAPPAIPAPPVAPPAGPPGLPAAPTAAPTGGLAKPCNRSASMAEMLRCVSEHTAAQPATSGPQSSIDVLKRFVLGQWGHGFLRRRTAAAVVAPVLFAALAVAMVGAVLLQRRALGSAAYAQLLTRDAPAPEAAAGELP